jgi:hypothetical protein
MNKFWQNWMSAWAVFVMLFGVILAAGAIPATDGATRLFFAILGKPLPEVPDELFRFTIGLIGAITIGWGLTFYAAFKALHSLDGAVAAPIWRFLNIGIFAWYIIDSAISIATGFWTNAVSNTLLMILYYIPVLKSGVMRG